MNCHEVESVFSDLARNQMMDASLREKALSHAESCAGCAGRLADERALTEALRLIAAAGKVDNAPARVEASLVAAFREHHGALPSRSFGRTGTGTRRWLYVAAGVAAAAAIVMLLSLTVSRTRDSQPSTPEKAKNESGNPTAPGKAQPAPEPARSPVSPEPRRYRRGPTVAQDKQQPNRRDRDDRPKSDEIATDFIPLVNGESLAQLDSGQIVRVELPRSALMSFGLPMDMDRANEPIKADVVVGNDGLARAIRFVR